MRGHTFRIALAFATVFALATSIAMSQKQTVYANIPFDFTVGTLSMPAGNYFVRLNDVPGSIMIRNTDRSEGAFVLVRPIDPKDFRDAAPKMVFNQYGTHYFLSKIQSIDGVACELNKGKLEKELAVRAANTPTQKVNVALEKR
jgi:hypothetical protein